VYNGVTNRHLQNAKDTDNDEFYTRYCDVEGEMEAYVSCNADVFRDKIVLLPCDDYTRSNFTKYFSSNFNRLGLSKLISTCYGGLTDSRGKYQILERVGDRVVIHSGLLNGDGDFRSEEISNIRNLADFVITNPPFSLIREFMDWVYEKRKKFSIIGGATLPTYRSVVPMWVEGFCGMGASRPRHGKVWYLVPETYNSTEIRWKDGIRVAGVHSMWCCNIPYKETHFMKHNTMEWNLKHHKQLRDYCYRWSHKLEYMRYSNYDAIEVPYMDAIPSDYPGVMGVPITFFNFYSPKLYDFLGISNGAGSDIDSIYYGRTIEDGKINKYSVSCFLPCLTSKGIVNKEIFKRMFIRHKNIPSNS
jgi:hypothetical protein